ncbi:FAD-binding oxidoreductase [Kribbella sp. NPDC048915]|uniref:NAD(P)/FAD-dependent oxidoreductase n=1 Tax=Kribbella sp. NPDC048915 TaxID=3155148 RepID=UPI0033F402C6
MADRGIVVVGAGIVGASVAYHLAGRGRAVTLIDAGLPASGATRASFAWIGRPVSSDLPSAPLRYLAVDEYHRLEAELPELAIRWTGALSWDGFDDNPGPATDDVRSLEPKLATPPPQAFHHPDDGALDPIAATETLARAAGQRGARILLGTPVTALIHENESVTGVQTTAGTIPAETVVLAAGTGSVALCTSIGVNLPVEPAPAILVKLRATPGLVQAIVATPSLEARQLDDGTILAPTAYSGESDHQALQATAQQVRDRIAKAFEGAEDAEVVSVEVGWRPMPADDEPIIGRPEGTDGLYVTVMHSAITLAAAVGRLAADEIVTGQEAPELAGCRPSRFA